MPKPKRGNRSSVQKSANGRSKVVLHSDQSGLRTYSITDYRLEKPVFHVDAVGRGSEVIYVGRGQLAAAGPRAGHPKFVDKKEVNGIYRRRLGNRRMEAALENLYKQGKVVGGVYFGLGQEACSCA